MKKALFICLAVLFYSGLQAQGVFKIGVVAGIPTADAGDISNFVLGADAYYMFEKEDAILNFGPTVGIRNYFGEEISEGISVDDGQFLPIGGAARVTLLGVLTGGVDVGYAVGISDFLDGGFYFRPVVGLDILDILELNASYESISDAATWGNFNIGLLLAL
jgi:hypothetical protein